MRLCEKCDMFDGNRYYLLTDRAEYSVCWMHSDYSTVVTYVRDGNIYHDKIDRATVKRQYRLN